MAVFHYRALSPSGEAETGTLEGADEASAAAQLQSRGMLPVKIDRDGPGWLLQLLNTEITPSDGLGTRDRIVFTRTLATLVAASLPIDRALRTIQSLATRKPVRLVAGRLLDQVTGGRSLAEAMDEAENAFPRLYRAIVRAGEAGASLETTLPRLADLLEETERRRGALISALIYPAFLVVTAIGSIAILMAFVVPTFQPLLEDAGVEPPAITQIVIATGAVFAEHGLAILIATALAIFTLIVTLRAPAARQRWHGAALNVPLIGRLWRDFESAKFSRILGTLLQNGVPLPAALGLTRGAQGNMAFAREIDRVRPAVEDGRPMAETLDEGAVLSPIARQLIGVGQESGRLAEMLLKAAEILDGDFKRSFERLLSMLTPILTLVMGGLIAVIVSSILFALFSINELAL